MMRIFGLSEPGVQTVWINEKDMQHLIRLIDKDLRYLRSKDDPRDFRKVQTRQELRTKLLSILGEENLNGGPTPNIRD